MICDSDIMYKQIGYRGFIKNSPDIDPLKILDENLFWPQLTDDTTIFLKSSEQIPLISDKINTFSKASGLQLNLIKCELMAIHDCL